MSKNSFIYLCFVLLGLYLTAYQNTVDLIAAELNLNMTLMGMIVAAHFIGSMAAPPVFGRISDRRGIKGAVLTALFMVILGLLCLSLGHGLTMAAIGIVAVGCGFAASEGLLTSALAVMNPEQVEKAVGRSQMWFCVGAVAGPYVSRLLSGLPGGWRAGDVVLAALFVLCFLGLAYTPLTNVSSAPGTTSLNLFRAPALMLLCAALGAYVGIEQGTAFFMVSFYQASGLEAFAQTALTFYWAGMLAGRLTMTLVRKHHTCYAVATLAAAALALATALIVKDAQRAVPLFAATGFLLAAAWPALAATAAKRYPSHSGAATGYMMAAGAVGGAFVPGALGVLAAQAGIRAAMFMLPALVVPTIALMLVAQLNATHRSSKRLR